MKISRAKSMTIAVMAAAFVTAFLALNFGAADLSEGDSAIFWRVRVPRVLLGFIVGGGLSLAGGVFQTLFRTPLATPFTLGVAGGASLGAVLSLTILGAVLPGWLGAGGAAFAGALVTVVLLFVLQRFITGVQSSLSLLLVGIMLNFFFSSLILFLQYLGDFSQVFRISRWMMGSLETVDYYTVWILAIAVTAAFLVSIYFSRALDLLAYGDEVSLSRGVDLRITYSWLLIVTSLSTGLIVARCGVIGFVGMIVPYLCRIIVGGSHRVMLSLSFLLGAVFLALCDTVGRTIIAPAEIPVGVITALIGAPLFLGLLLWGGSRERLVTG